MPAKIKLDNSGNVIIGATSDRDNSVSTNRDYLVIQYNSSGTQQWAQLYNGVGTGDDDLNDLRLTTFSLMSCFSFASFDENTGFRSMILVI